uniref:Cilia- and flagella-associated protein 99 n=1 Tax=Salvator merianae TaxID=96440 RepID=A0A8D0BYY1_SALMN
MKMASLFRPFEIVIQRLNQFDPENENMGHFLDESAKLIQAYNFTEETLIIATLFGCIKYKPLLDVVVNAYYVRDGKHCKVSEHNLYIIVCYLATFQLEELGLQQFRKIIKSMGTAKICKFLRFYFNEVNLCTWISDEWSQIYDSVYVKDNWIDPLLKRKPKIHQLIDQLTERLSTCTIAASEVTKPKEFILTTPKPRTILIPDLIPQKEKTKSVPESTYRPPRLIQRLEKIKLKNRWKAEERLLEASFNQFTSAVPKLDHKCALINEMPKYEKKFQAQKIIGDIDNVPVKLNATAILREDVLYQRKVEQELERIEHLLRGAQDVSKFLEWQKQILGKELDQQLTDTECRRLQGKLSYEEAILARQNCLQNNQKNAEQVRREKREINQQHEESRLQDRKERKRMAQKVAEGRKNVKQAQTKLQKSKRQIVQEVSEESQGILLQFLKEEEEKYNKRYELVKQRRAIEYVSFLNKKFIDLTQIANHGVFGEMSIAELQERLALLNQTQKKVEEEKRDLIIQEKHAKEQLLLEKLDQISMFREQFGRAAALKQEEKKTKVPVCECILKDKQVLDLQKKIAERSAERKAQTEFLKTAPPKYSEWSKKSWGSKRISQQEDHWKKLEESRQQQFKMLQHGFMSREMTKKWTANEALKTGTSACIMRS